MKTLIAAVFLLTTPAYAFNVYEAVEVLDAYNLACVSNQDHDGEPVTEPESKKACLIVIETLRELSSNGYCYTDDNWTLCRS